MPTIVHFDISADDPQRARRFYESLFGWKIESLGGMSDYFLIETEDSEGNKSVGGGLGKRGDPAQRITAYIGVDSIEEACNQAEALGGKVLQPRMTVPGWGYLAVCLDTEGNPIGLFQDDKNAG